MNKRNERIGRREFLRVSALAAGGVVLAACGGSTNTSSSKTPAAKSNNTPGQSSAQNPSTQKSPEQLQFNPPPVETPTTSGGAPQGGGTSVAQPTSGSMQGSVTQVATQGAQPTVPVPKSFSESPNLKSQVSGGKLPKVEERLPKTPMVLKPLDEVGKYGGEWRLAHFGGPGALMNPTIGYEQLLRWKPGTTALTADQVIPDLAESFEVAKNGAEYTFKLRQGIKWSDGKPFTADDILFWYNDVQLNKDLSPAFPDWMQVGGKTGKDALSVEKTDDYTVVFKFTQPNGLFITNMATQRGTAMVDYPAHYLKQFHKKYNPKAVQEAKKQKLDSWTNLFFNMGDDWGNPEKPTLYAWKLKKPIGANTQRAEAERNPYYWKVDTEGNQLPYMDKVVYTIEQKPDTAVLQAANGEFDMIAANINQPDNKPVFFKNKDKGNYDFFTTIPQQMNYMIINLNMTSRDKNKQKLFTDKNFRIGLSYAINRPEIINVIYHGLGEPYQAAPRKETPFYNEKLAKQYTEFDTKQANQYLDKVMPKKDSKGVRLGPNGKPFYFLVEISDIDPQYADVMALVKKYWADVGIHIDYKLEAGDLFGTRIQGNEHDACTWRGGGGFGCMMDSFYYGVPYNFNTRYGIPWTTWFHNPKDPKAIKPPKIMLKEIDIYRKLLSEPDYKKQIALMKQILDIAVDQFWVMGISYIPKGYGIFSNRLGNTPKQSITGWLHAEMAPNNPQQYYIKE